jgi:hypothetical protein
MKKYMIVERFKPGCFDKVYERYNSLGRFLPPGLFYLNSWVNKEKNICFQLMETNNETLFAEWTEIWKDRTDFDIFPID